MSVVEIALRVLCIIVPLLVMGLAFRRCVQSLSPNVVLYGMNGMLAGFALSKSAPAMLPAATPTVVDFGTGLAPMVFWAATLLIVGRKTRSRIRYSAQNPAPPLGPDRPIEIQLSSLLPNPTQGANSEA